MVLLWGLFFVLCFSEPLAQAQQAQPSPPPTLFQQCSNPQYHDQALAFGGIQLEQYNMFCGPDRLSDESINLMRVNLSYTARVIRDMSAYLKATQSKKPAVTPLGNAGVAPLDSFSAYQDDGLCLSTEQKIEECLARWKRLRVDIEAQIARDAPAINAAHLGMISDQNKLTLGNASPNGQKPVSGGVLFDLYGQSRTAPQKLNARSIDTAETQKTGQDVLSSSPFKEVDDKDVKDQWLQQQLNMQNDANPGIEVQGQAVDQSLTGAAQKDNAKLSAKYGKDAANEKLAIQRASQSGITFMGQHAWALFKATMDYYNSLVTQKDPTKYVNGLKSPPDDVGLRLSAPLSDHAADRSLANQGAAAKASGASPQPSVAPQSNEGRLLENMQDLLNDPN